MNKEKIFFYTLSFGSFLIEGLNTWTKDHKNIFAISGIIFFLIGLIFFGRNTDGTKTSSGKETIKLMLAIVGLTLIGFVLMGGFGQL